MSTLMRYNLYRELVELRRTMNRLADWMWVSNPFFTDWIDRQNNLAVDMIEKPDAVIIRASLPGFDTKDIDVSVKGDWLVISAKSASETEQKGIRWHLQERQFQHFYRELKLPPELKGKQAEAELENGVLTIRLPKNNPGPLESIKVAVKKILPKVQRPQLSAKTNRN